MPEPEKPAPKTVREIAAAADFRTASGSGLEMFEKRLLKNERAEDRNGVEAEARKRLPPPIRR